MVTGTATDKGDYVITGAPGGKVVVTAKYAGFLTAVYSTTVARGRNLLDLGLEVGRLADTGIYRVHGVVASESKTKLADATVTLRNLYQPSSVVQVRTDGAGAYTVETQNMGDYVLSAALPGYEAAVRGVTLNTVSNVSVELNMKQAKR